MFNLTLVTSAYTNLRKSRSSEYYLRPLRDLVDELSGSKIGIFVFTNEPLSFDSPNVFVSHIPVDDLAAEMWGLPNWREDYQHHLRGRPTHRFEEAVVPELIGLWLGKFVMMEHAAAVSQNVLWVDSGLKMGRLCRKQFSNYFKSPIDPERFEAKVLARFEKYSYGFMQNYYQASFHGVEMRKYETDQSEQIAAGCIYSRSGSVPELKDGIKRYWAKLIENNDYGTEENPLTLYRWERKDCLCIPYEQWIDLLGFNKKMRVKMV